MIAEDFLARLERVKRAGERSWTARCPAHADKGPSLKITDADGKILIHCFAGCSPHEIVSAVGIQLQELFPPRNPQERAKYRRELFVRGTLKDMERELWAAIFTLRDVETLGAKRAADTLSKLLREIGRAA